MGHTDNMTLNTVKQPSSLHVVVQSIFSPVTFDFWASHIHPTWSWERPLARIVARKIEAQNSVTLTLKSNRHSKAFAAGQHINITAEIKGIRYTRSYSPSAVPNQSRQSGVFNITIKRMDGGKVSTWLVEHAKVGQVVELGAPFGEMTLSTAHQNHVFLAAGSGITPFISLIRDWLAQGAHGNMTLVYWAKTRAELCFVPELNSLNAKLDNFQVHYALTQEPLTHAHELRERISKDLLKVAASDLDASAVYACGPAQFVERARSLAEDAKDFHGEAFSIAQLVPIGNEMVSIQLTKSNRNISVPVGQSILTALEAQGLKPASGCRMGICNSCVCIKQAGTTEHILTKAQDHEIGSSVRICMSSARSDLTLDL
jgi:ferredoxin-NADP reductase